MLNRVVRAVVAFGFVALLSAPAFAQSYLRMQGNDQVHVLELLFERGCAARVAVADGEQGTLKSEKGEEVRFIAKVNAAGVLQLIPVYAEKMRRGLVEVDGLRAGAPFAPGEQAPERIAAGGLKSVKHVRSVSGEVFRSLSTKRDIIIGNADQAGGKMIKVGAGDKCCSFTGCENTNWTFCTTGDSGCGMDDCGGCCV